MLLALVLLAACGSPPVLDMPNPPPEPLFDTPRFVKNLEAAYRRMWEVHTSGHPPTHITVVDEHSQD